MIVKIDETRFNSLMNNAMAFSRVIGRGLVITEIVKLGRTVAICITDECDVEQYLEQK
jgi:hypothetical protein